MRSSERLLQEELDVTSDVVPKEPFFVDFMQECPEPTGEEPEGADLDAPKIYEQANNNISGVGLDDMLRYYNCCVGGQSGPPV